MEWKDPVARLYSRISGAEPILEEEIPRRALLQSATAVLLSGLFGLAVACGPGPGDAALDPRTRSSRVEGAGCDVGDGGAPPDDDDTCTVTGAFTTASTGNTVSSASDTGNTTGATATTTTVPPDAGVPAPASSGSGGSGSGGSGSGGSGSGGPGPG